MLFNYKFIEKQIFLDISFLLEVQHKEVMSTIGVSTFAVTCEKLTTY